METIIVRKDLIKKLVTTILSTMDSKKTTNVNSKT